MSKIQSIAAVLFVSVFCLVSCGSSGTSGGGGTSTDCTNNAICNLLNGNVFCWGNKWESVDPNQTISGFGNLGRKICAYFGYTSSGLKYVKVSHDTVNNAWIAYGGEVALNSNTQATFTDNDYCAQNEWNYTRQSGDTFEDVYVSVSACNDLTGSAQRESRTFTLSQDTSRDRTILYSADGSITLSKAFPKLPTSLANEPFKNPLGVYQLMAGATDTVQYTGTTSWALSTYAASNGNMRFTHVAMDDVGMKYQVSEGTITATTANSVTFTPDYIGIDCNMNFMLVPMSAPIYPPYFRWEGLCTSADTTNGLPILNTKAAHVFTYDYRQTEVTIGVPHYTLQLVEQATGLVYNFKKTSTISPNDFPATTGTGAHYIWSVVPQSLIQ